MKKMSEWTTQRLEEIIQVNPTVKLAKGEVYPFIDIDKVSPSLRSVTNEEEKVYDGQSCSKFCNGDTVFSRITPCLENRKIAKVSIDGQAAFGSTEFYIFRAKKGKSDEDFVYYLTSSDAVVLPAINSMTGASGRQRADKRFIERTKLNVPDLPTQKRIADILSAYDDLIENNNRRIALLEKAAQELYKEWFVRFRFPGYENAKFESGLPEGWKIAKLGTLCKVITGKKDANEATGQGIYPFFTCARETTLFTDEYILDTNAILISGNGSYTGLVKKHSGKFDLYQRTYALYDFQNIEWLYLYWTMKIDFEREFMGGSRGSAIPYITRPNIEKFKIIVPPRDIMKKAQQTFEQIHNECLYLERQNKNLVKQRDLLLPRLMSGKLEV
ncbi:MAG: restriction endonuclease subunit S [Clostridia bacterium]|nr:restriction endonuclease subunit S [Clostridia bacterium]